MPSSKPRPRARRRRQRPNLTSHFYGSAPGISRRVSFATWSRHRSFSPPAVDPQARAGSPFRVFPVQELRFRVRAAFLAARERSAAPRTFAAACAWRDNARDEAAARGCRFRACVAARERLAEGFVGRRPLALSRAARFLSWALPRLGGGNFTPARLALDKPMAIACFAEAAPCLPSRICSIVSLTNSPA